MSLIQLQMSKARQTLSISGFSNVLMENRRRESCSVTGTHKLLHNNLLTVTGTLLYERISGSGSLLPYLAAVSRMLSSLKPIKYRIDMGLNLSTSVLTPIQSCFGH